MVDDALLDQVLARAIALRDEDDRGRALAALAPRLDAKAAETALAAARDISDGSLQRDIFAALAPRLRVRSRLSLLKISTSLRKAGDFRGPALPSPSWYENAATLPGPALGSGTRGQRPRTPTRRDQCDWAAPDAVKSRRPALAPGANLLVGVVQAGPTGAGATGGALLGWQPENVLRWLSNNPEGPEPEEQKEPAPVAAHGGERGGGRAEPPQRNLQKAGSGHSGAPTGSQRIAAKRALSSQRTLPRG